MEQKSQEYLLYQWIRKCTVKRNVNGKSHLSWGFIDPSARGRKPLVWSGNGFVLHISSRYELAMSKNFFRRSGSVLRFGDSFNYQQAVMWAGTDGSAALKNNINHRKNQHPEIYVKARELLRAVRGVMYQFRDDDEYRYEDKYAQYPIKIKVGYDDDEMFICHSENPLRNKIIRFEYSMFEQPGVPLTAKLDARFLVNAIWIHAANDEFIPIRFPRSDAFPITVGSLDENTEMAVIMPMANK